MEKLAGIITDRLLNQNVIDADKKEIHKTGIELILTDTINFSLILIIGIMIKAVSAACIYLLLFWTVRRFSGGYHAKSYGVCRTVTVGTYIAIVLISKFLAVNQMLVSVVLNIVTAITMMAFAPIRHPNKELTITEIRANKLFSVLTTLFYIALSIILSAFGNKQGLIIAITLFAISVLMYLGLLMNMRGEQNYEKN
ncbi:MAG: accessory gene regulator B family protein [Clostridia bacterium]|nr:accessory gene regulator B family protein [Clostridia bacterium]